MEHLILDFDKEVGRLQNDYQSRADDIAFTKSCATLISDYVRHLLTSDAVRRKVAKSAFTHGVRIKKGGELLGAGAEFEHGLVNYLNDILTAAGFKKGSKNYQTGTQSLTKKLTAMFVKEKGRPAAETRFNSQVKAVAIEYCSGLLQGPGELTAKLQTTARDHLTDALISNQTVGTEAVNLGKKYHIVMKEGGGRTFDTPQEYRQHLAEFLHGLLDDARVTS